MSDYKNSAIRNTNLIDDKGLNVFWNKIKDIIENNEQVTVATLTVLATKCSDLETKYNNIDTEALYYLLNPVNLSNVNSIPPDMLEQNTNEFDIKEKYIDTRYFIYKGEGTAYSVMSIYYTNDNYEFTMAEGCPKQKYTWDASNGTLS